MAERLRGRRLGLSGQPRCMYSLELLTLGRRRSSLNKLSTLLPIVGPKTPIERLGGLTAEQSGWTQACSGTDLSREWESESTLSRKMCALDTTGDTARHATRRVCWISRCCPNTANLVPKSTLLRVLASVLVQLYNVDSM
jgi:hypothetical protein